MDDKVFVPEVIEETPFPGEGEVVIPAGVSSPNGTYTPTVSKEGRLPTRKIAVELISTALNTKSKKILKEFEFSPSGAIQIGNYQSGEAGDIRISPDGFVARNKAGLETIAIDGDTGDAVFKGSIQAGSVITGLITVGDNKIIIDGESQQIIINDGTHDRVLIGYQKDGF